MTQLDDAGIYARESPTIDRWVQVGVAGGRVLQVSFPETPKPDAGTDHTALEAILEHLETGAGDGLGDVPVGLTVPTDQRSVLETLRSVPPGETVTLETLGRMTPGTDPDDRTLLERTLASNPAPVLIPDHRVRGATGATPAPVREHLLSVEGI